MGLDMYLTTKQGNREEEKLYWRKANAIHNWFVSHVQDGIDDCGSYYVKAEQLQELLDTVNKVLASSELIDDMVVNGFSIKAGETQIMPDYEVGKRITDSTVARELLPAVAGFFFGSTDYDQGYYEDLAATKEGLERILAEGAADIFYHSSW